MLSNVSPTDLPSMCSADYVHHRPGPVLKGKIKKQQEQNQAMINLIEEKARDTWKNGTMTFSFSFVVCTAHMYDIFVQNIKFKFISKFHLSARST